MLDLHMHTTRSDGNDEPKELLKKVIDAGCKLFSVTDHDCISAISEIKSELNTCKHDITFIPGMEVSSIFKGYSLHILCYNFDCSHESITFLIEEIELLRKKRILYLFEYLAEKHNIYIPQADILETLSIPRRLKFSKIYLHIAQAALKNGLTDLQQDDFVVKYFEDIDKTIKKMFIIPAEEVIQAVRKAGGFTSFAHPVKLQQKQILDFNTLDDFIKSLANCGIFAVEAYHYLHNESDVINIKNIAKKYDLKLTAGSDYHGKREYLGVANLSAEDANYILKGLPL